MGNIDIVCGIGKHAIYANDSEFVVKAPTDVTIRAIQAVRDYMVDDIKHGENSVGYAWKRSDGKAVRLICVVEDYNGQ